MRRTGTLVLFAILAASMFFVIVPGLATAHDRVVPVTVGDDTYYAVADVEEVAEVWKETNGCPVLQKEAINDCDGNPETTDPVDADMQVAPQEY